MGYRENEIATRRERVVKIHLPQ